MRNFLTPPQHCGRYGMLFTSCVIRDGANVGAVCNRGPLTRNTDLLFSRSDIWSPQFVSMHERAPAPDENTEGFVFVSPPSVQQQQQQNLLDGSDKWGGIFRAPEDANSFYRLMVGLLVG